MKTSSSLVEFARSKTATVIVFLIVAASFAFYSYRQPWAHFRHQEHRMPLPLRYILVSLDSGDTVKANRPTDAYIQKKFGANALVQEVASRKIYDKLFPEGQEHIVFTGQQNAGLMTVDKSVVWVYKDWYGFGRFPITFSVADNTLISRMVIEPDVVKMIYMAILTILSCFFYKTLVELLRAIWLKLQQRPVRTQTLGA